MTQFADVGCGHCASPFLMGTAYPNTSFIGSDDHTGSIVAPRRRAGMAKVDGHVDFEAAGATLLSRRDYDLVTMFDFVHDIGDPEGVPHGTSVRRSPRMERG